MIPKKLRETLSQGIISPTDAYTYLLLREHAEGNHSIRILRATIAADLGFQCLESVSEHLKSLRAAGLIRTNRTQGGGSEYILLAEDQPNQSKHRCVTVVQHAPLTHQQMQDLVREMRRFQ